MKNKHPYDISNNFENRVSNKFDDQFDFTGIVIPQTIGNYQILQSIGFGAYSLVKLCKRFFCLSSKNHIDVNKEELFACKIIPKIRLTNERMKQSLESEIRIIQQLHHPGIVQLIELLKDENNYYVILEYCPKGDLFSHIIKNKKIAEPEAKYIFKQILQALKYIQFMNVSHRDLKPENILFDKDNHIKISDFGLSKYILESENFLVRTPCGSPCYVSPECISGRPYNGKTTDVWSCGVILYTMLTGHIPWTKNSEEQVFRQIKRAQYICPKYISIEAKLLINGLLTVDINRRYTVDMALKDPWLKGTPIKFNLNSNLNKFVSIKKVDQFFDREISDDSLINILKIRKRGNMEHTTNEYNLNDEKESRNKKKLSFFQRLKIKKAVKTESKSKIKSQGPKTNEIYNNISNCTIKNNNIYSNNTQIKIDTSNADYFYGLKQSFSSPIIKLLGNQSILFLDNHKNQKIHSEECSHCNYI